MGRSTLLRCYGRGVGQSDPGSADSKRIPCTEAEGVALDALVVPRLEVLKGCPALAGVTGRTALGVDIDFKAKTVKVTAGKATSLARAGKRDDRALDAVLACLRADLRDLAETSALEHARYVLSYPVTITPTAEVGGAAAPSPFEKPVSGTATVQVDTAIVRDAPNVNGAPIGRLGRGVRVLTVGTSGHWYHIKFGDNDAQDGWVFRTNIGR